MNPALGAVAIVSLVGSALLPIYIGRHVRNPWGAYIGGIAAGVTANIVLNMVFARIVPRQQ